LAVEVLDVDIGKTPFFQLLRERLGYLGGRQAVLAENVSNANTPGFKPRDMNPKTFEAHVAPLLNPKARGIRPVALMATTAGHFGVGGTAMKGTAGSMSVKPTRSVDSETTLDGNAVVLEEQMIKVAETRMQYETAITLYQKGLAIMRTAARSPSQ
jgi:flagellar basal-body rod protein FlgB